MGKPLTMLSLNPLSEFPLSTTSSELGMDKNAATECILMPKVSLSGYADSCQKFMVDPGPPRALSGPLGQQSPIMIMVLLRDT